MQTIKIVKCKSELKLSSILYCNIKYIYIENRDQIHRNLFCCFLFWYLLAYIACCNLIMQRNNTIENGSENRSSFLSESSWVLRKKSISKRRLRSRVPCSPLLYSYSHSSVHGGMLHAGVLVLLLCDLPCDLSVWWWWWWLEFRVIYVCHLDRDPTVIFILFGHRSQPRSLVGHQQVIFLRVLFLLSRARFESIYQCHIKPLNGNGW